MKNQTKQNHSETARQETFSVRKRELDPNIIRTTWLIGIVMFIVALLIVVFAPHKSYFEYTEEDVRILGDLMYAEVGFLYETEEPKDIKQAHILAGSVVLHRLETRLFGETMKEVICAPGQYHWTTLEAIGNIDTPKEVYKWAEYILKHGPKGPDNLIYESQFEQGADTYWKIDGKVYFCVLDGITKKVEGGKVN